LVEFGRILRLVEFSRFLRCRVDISRNLAFMEFGGILRLVESSGFLRYRVDISRNLRLVDLSRFPKFYFRFRFRPVYYKAFLLIIGGSK
jgi:hypothetical protein